MSETIEFREAFSKLLDSRLDGETVRRSFDAILGGAWSQSQIAGWLTALRVQGESAETIASAAIAMRSAMVHVSHAETKLLDTCGTGGDGSGTVNLSTGAAIICAAVGVKVAKHGNRAVSSKAGSADVLTALGIPIDLPSKAASTLLSEIGLCFMMAPTHHPAMRFAMPVRRELGVRTIFNCLGPLANPAKANYQLIGAFADELRPILAGTLKQLGTARAWVVRGEDGLDEISPYGGTRVTQLDEGKLDEFSVTPADFGLALSPTDAAIGGDAEVNARIIETVLSGAPHRARDAFVVNAAAALVVVNSMSLRDAATLASAALYDGRALHKLNSWRKAAASLREA